ncbi:hypothetical protein PMAYCL1PPCAC_00513, partial [Pristionchus mayeri]
IVPHPRPIECQMDMMIQNLVDLEDAHNQLRISSYTPKHLPGLTLEDFFHGPSKLGMNYPPMQSEPY